MEQDGEFGMAARAVKWRHGRPAAAGERWQPGRRRLRPLRHAPLQLRRTLGLPRGWRRAAEGARLELAAQEWAGVAVRASLPLHGSNERSHTSSDRQEGNWAAIALLTPAAAAHRAQRCVRPSAEVVSPSQCRVDCSARAQHLRWLGCDGWPPPGRCRAWEPGHRRCSADEAPAPPADWGPASHPLPLAQQARSYYSV